MTRTKEPHTIRTTLYDILGDETLTQEQQINALYQALHMPYRITPGEAFAPHWTRLEGLIDLVVNA